MSDIKKRQVHTAQFKAPAAHQDPDQMLKKIGQLEMELDWLKKKLGINP